MRRDSTLRRLAACGMTMAALTTGVALVAGPAEAVPGLQRVSATTASDSSPTKSVAAVCPAGQRVIGGGGDVAGGGGQVVLEQLQPEQTATDDRFTVTASEDGTGFDGNWQLTAYALCTDPLPGQQIVSVGQPPSSDRLQSSLALCGGTQTQVGYGGRVSGGNGQVRLTDMFPFFDPPPSVTFVRALEDSDGFDGLWSVTSYAVCADAATGFTQVSVLSPATSADKYATVSCPVGTQVHSAGGQLVGSAGATGRIVIDGVNIDASLGNVTVDAAEDETATTGTWSVRANAVCAP
jgi:hypothetical protein